MSVQYMGGYSAMEDIMGTPGGYHELGDTLSPDTTALRPSIITDGRIPHQTCFKLASIIIHCLLRRFILVGHLNVVSVKNFFI